MLEIKCPKCGEKIKLGKDEYNALLNDLEKEEINNQVNIRVQEIKKQYEAEYALEANKMKGDKDKEISELQNKINILNERLSSSNKDAELKVTKALEAKNEEISKRNEEIIKLKSELNNEKNASALSNQKLKEDYEIKLKLRDDEINRWKEYRMGDSTKDLGESLEQYCREAFDEIRAYAYPNAYFEKDSLDGEKTKGDFIFRDYSDDDKENEMVSIMFEMKNQKEDGDTKNESHFKKLDSDRNKKNCEYAVLVSTLEPDSKLYSTGIVDVSYRYPKMFVVRPQFFLTIIGLIKNMAKTRFEYKRQVIQYQRENVDITNFEAAVKSVTDKITADYEKAGAIYSEVDKMCDDIVKKVETFRKEFKTATNWIEKAKNQLPNLEIRKLTRGNSTMKEKFEDLKNKIDD